MSSAVGRLTSKLEEKLAGEDYYEAHQLYRTIYFRLQRDIKFNFILTAPEDSAPSAKWTTLLENRVEFVAKNPSYTFLLEFLAKGATALLTHKELISGLDLIKLFLAQFNHFLFESHAKPGTATAELQAQADDTVRTGYYNLLQKWFDLLMDVFQLYAETGLEMVQNKASAQTSKGFVEADFLSERDQLLENILQISKNLRVMDPEMDPTEVKITNALVRSHGHPEMHLRNGRMLMRFQELGKAKHCFMYGQDSFELAKFLYFYHKTQHTPAEYELVLVKAVLKVLNTQLFINAKPGTYGRQNAADTFKKLKIAGFTDDEMATAKVRALNSAKEVFYFYLAITKFFILRDPQQAAINTTRHFKQMHLLKFCNFYLILLEELLRQEDTVPAESSYHFHTKLMRLMKKHFKFNGDACFVSDRETDRFLTFFGNRKDYAEALSDAVTADGKLYLLDLFYELRTNIYKPTLDYCTKWDRELDLSLMDRIFFVYYNDAVPQRLPDLREGDVQGYFEPEQSRTQQQQPNLFNLLLGGMAGGSGGPSSMGGGGPDGGGGLNLMSFLNDFMQ